MFSQIYQGGPPEDPDEKMEAVLDALPTETTEGVVGADIEAGMPGTQTSQFHKTFLKWFDSLITTNSEHFCQNFT